MLTASLTACSSEDMTQDGSTQDGTGGTNETAVAFDAYAARSTRAGDAQDVDLDYLKGNDASGNAVGFGVYAYDTGTLSWNAYVANRTYPNFMYNQQVTWDGSNWTYSPLKYWPNNAGGRLSFFAYAPYESTDERLALSTTYGGPAIRYVATSKAKEQKDLLYATALTDKTKANTTEKLTFAFKHALARVDFVIKAFLDQVHTDADHSATNTGDGHTTVTIRSIKLVGAVPSQGVLSLLDGTWIIEQANEGAYFLSGSDFYNGTTQTNVIPLDANVATTRLTSKPWFVIPTLTGCKLQVSYDVTTAVAGDARNTVTVNNVITSDKSFTFKQGTRTTFHLDLGLTSVKFDATVEDWPADQEAHVDLTGNTSGNP